MYNAKSNPFIPLTAQISKYSEKPLEDIKVTVWILTLTTLIIFNAIIFLEFSNCMNVPRHVFESFNCVG